MTELCGRVYVLDKGEVVTCCAPSELVTNRRVVEAYLGTRKPPPSAARVLPGDEPRPREVAS